MTPSEYGQKARHAFYNLRQTTSRQRNRVLDRLAYLLRDETAMQTVLAANQKDLAAASDLAPALRERLTLSPARLQAMAQAVTEISAMKDPVGEVIQGHRHPTGMEMIQKRVPLGVLFVIFESRPNVTVDIAALSLKSGNAAILRGGKEASHTNRALYELIAQSLKAEGLDPDAVLFVTDPDREIMLQLLQLQQYIDLVVPRGGEGLIRFVSEHSKIPVVKHDQGVCNMYVDVSADFEQALAVATNAKLQRPSVCNAIENLLIHKDYSRGADLLQKLHEAGVELLGCADACRIAPQMTPIADPDREYATEYLDARLAVKMVADLPEVLTFIQRYGSGHSEIIMAQENQTIQNFLSGCDSAALFVNCSSRFHDGGEMGMGAEVGISTGRLHVRGPMGLEHLTTTTWIVQGHGQIRS